MKKVFFILSLAMLCASSLFAKVVVQKDEKGWRLLDNGREVEVKGLTWSNNPIGENYNYSLWAKDDAFIKNMIDYDMPMLKAMGVNAIRCFNDVPPKWVEYIYENYGIYTIINNLLGRYGVTVNGVWQARTDYSDPATCEVLYQMAVETVEKYKDTNGVLLFMWGNESNYGLEWSGSDIENLPVGERHKAKAVFLYKMFNEAIRRCKEIDKNHPHGIVNGDTQYIDLIAEYCPDMDIFGSNVYRGWKFYDSFYQDVKDKLDRPIVVTECGADAFNSITNKEDQYAQLQYYKTQWREIYDQSYGKGKCGNILGCFVFEWVDEWWKYLQYTNLEIHDEFASWANGGYSLDFKEGQNNMSEEWFGICAQSKEKNAQGINIRVPRAVYYFLSDVWQLSMYQSTPEQVAKRFDSTDDAIYLVRGNDQSVKSSLNEFNLLKIQSITTNVQSTTPVYVNGVIDALKNHESFREGLVYRNSEGDKKNEDATVNKTRVAAESEIKFAIQPFDSLKGSTTLKVMTGENISRLRDPYSCYYEDYSQDSDKETVYDHKKYVDLYAADVQYTGKYLDINGFYHSGHAGYAGNGDVFGISQDAWDIIGYDTYGSKAPIGIEVKAKGKLSGLNFIGGPEIWGGASPMVIANYMKWFPEKGLNKPGFVVAATASSEFGEKQVIQLDPFGAYGSGNKVGLLGQMYIGSFIDAKLGLLYSGDEKVGARYVTASGETKQIGYLDTLGATLSLTTKAVPLTTIHVDAAYRGLVASSGGAQAAGGRYISDNGSGNRFEVIAGADVGLGAWGFGTAFRFRQPLEEAAERSLLSGSPFSVDLGNRACMEIDAGVTYDPEGGTYFYNWDANETENAKIAFSLGGHYVLSAGETDTLIYKDNQDIDVVTSNGQHKKGQQWLNGGTLGEQSGMWDVGFKIISNPMPGLKLIGNLSAGRANSLTGYYGDNEYITFYRAGFAGRWKKLIASTDWQIDAPAPEGWWSNFNMTFPLQYTFDIAYGLGKGQPSFIDGKNRIGMKIVGRSFGDNCADSYHALPQSVVEADDIDGKHYMEVSFYLSLGL